MTGPVTAGDPWGRLHELSDPEWQALTDATFHVIQDEADGATLVDATSPPVWLRRQLRSELASEGLPTDDRTVDRLVTDDRTARQVSLAIIEGIASDPDLRERIEQAYRARRGMMVIEGGVLIGAALLLLVAKLRRIRVEKGKLDVQFYQASDTALQQVQDILGQP
ncbi:hypothetical protein [Phytohabitans aurantiacus]|uniref:Uncharacterized protein n=1 Tax=Phytohabitans aurantiacus TaxID=3016789 RepID=A0ABQ5QXT9_9ACTN|nr:hypothetical protein [Phytohabitans aurantiacus]GLH98857.1 hypothetical protein Pa4123_41320 [Phytohabitans aurantiacus]